MRHWTILAAMALALALALTAGAARAQEDEGPAAAQAMDDEAAVLRGASFWHYHIQVRPPVVPVAALRAAGVQADSPQAIPVYVTYRGYPEINRLETPAPPADWAAAGFDDSAWPQARLGDRSEAVAGIGRIVAGPGIGLCVGRLSVRGRFTVTDPAAVSKLQLSFAYRGGVAVYLNGRQVARADLPAGPLADDTPGDPYPDDCWVDAQGRCIPDYRGIRELSDAGRQDILARLAQRNSRRLESIELPVSALTKGVNVLAIEVRRSDYHPAALTREWPSPWAPIGLYGLLLTAAGGGIRPNDARPDGVQLWNADVTDRICIDDYGDPNEPLRPIELAACRNGTFSGEVALSSTDSIRGLKVVASDLKADGGATLAASAVRVRFPRLDGAAYGVPAWFDGILDAAPAEVAVSPAGSAIQPLWISVVVPRDAAPGCYAGQVTVSADGIAPMAVPLRVTVNAWTLPDPKSFRTYVGLYQSPTSLALRYGVPEWSEPHWRLMAKSFDLLQQVGNKLVNIPVVEQTQFGNDEGMVYWIRKPDGTFDHDFAVLDRYLDLVERRLGVPDFVALQIWHSWGWEARAADQKNTVTVVDPKTGAHEHMQVPEFGTPASKAFWKPLLDAIHERLAKRKMDKAMCMGILSDGTAPQPVFAMFDEIWPGGGPSRWMRGCHQGPSAGLPYPVRKGGAMVVLHEHCYGMSMAVPSAGLPRIWEYRDRVTGAFIRHNFANQLSLVKYRNMTERALYCGTRGIGRTGIDFFGVLGPKHEVIYNRWPQSSCAQRAPSLYAMAAPGPDGPIATVRFENMREGLQETEATLVVSEALGEHEAALGPDLAAECRSLLLDRLNYSRQRAPEVWGRVYLRANHLGRAALTARIYAAAAKVADKLGRTSTSQE